MGIKFSNNASANIIQALTPTATSVSVTPDKGDLFPSLTEGDYFYATLAGNNGLEIVKVTNRVKDTMTIVRAQDNTIALSFDTGDLFELRIVAADFNDTFSEVNDKLEASIEENTSIVNSALASKAPTFHASVSDEFGAGSSTQYGHLKTHDTPDATLTADSGYAFTPAGAAAMQESLEEGIEEAKRNAESAHFTATIDGLDLVLSFEDGTEKRVKLPAGKSVGDLWIGFDPASKPANVQVYGGQLLSRSAYEAHSSMVLGGERTVLTDAEWQEHVASNGFCPFYSSGDGSTTYRMPLIKGVHPEFVAALAEAGSFVQAGLPNITGRAQYFSANAVWNGAASGAFKKYGDTANNTKNVTTNGEANGYYFDFDASLSNPIYGNSDTVQPPSVTCVLGEYVFGVVSRLGEADVEDLAERIDKLEIRAPGVPIGTLLPYTGKDVPAGMLRADGAVYNMKASFPDFYDWVVNYGPTVSLADYYLVEGNCGYYGLDESTGTVRMPTITNGFVGAATAGQYGQAVQAGLPNITGVITYITADNTNTNSGDYPTRGAFRWLAHDYSSRAALTSGSGSRDLDFSASRSSPIYGNSDTVTPSHVKYPWVIVVYNAAVPPSVAQAGEFIGLLDGKADKAQVTEGLATVVAPGFVMSFAANSDPEGYLLCNGAAVSRTTYAALFSAIGITYGTGDGSTTFNLPNLTDKFIQGSGTAGTVKKAGLPNIAGSITAYCLGRYQDVSRSGALTGADGGTKGSEYDGSYKNLKINFNAKSSNSIYGASSTVQPPALTMRYYIKY